MSLSEQQLVDCDHEVRSFTLLFFFFKLMIISSFFFFYVVLCFLYSPIGIAKFELERRLDMDEELHADFVLFVCYCLILYFSRLIVLACC